MAQMGLTQGVVNVQPTVMAFQPTVTTTVVTQQPKIIGWSSGICDCFNDMKSCICTILLGNLYFGCLAQRMGENFCVGCSGEPAGCVPGGHMSMRTKLRTQHGIQGDICDDCCVLHCCRPCAMCQMSREMDYQGYPPGQC